MLRHALRAGILCALVVAGCDSSTPPPPDMTPFGPCGAITNPIVASGHTFLPAACTVAAGSVVNWRWGSGNHSVTSDPGAAATFDSGIESGATFQFTIPATAASGTVINYHCQNHGFIPDGGGACQGMCATITVQ